MTTATVDSFFSLSSTWVVIILLSVCIVYGLVREWYLRSYSRHPSSSSSSSSWFSLTNGNSSSSISSSSLFASSLLGRHTNTNPNIICPPKVTNTLFSYGVAESMGRRPYMEDRHIVQGELTKHTLYTTNTNHHPQQHTNHPKNPSHIPSSFYGVFDGHGGIAAANYCVTHMVNHLVSSSSFPSFPDQALKYAFNRTDNDFLSKANNCFPPLDDGTCAIAALIVQNILYVANVGDSRAVLITTASSASSSSNLNSTSIRLTTPNSFMPQNTNKNFTVISLSEDHKPLRADELRRIKELGGNVVFHGVWRVEGILAVSRAIGDRLLKRYVTSDPELRRYELRTPYDIAIVLASDGVWDVLTNSDVANIVLRSKDCQQAADHLIQAALQAGSMDNVTAIVIDLTRPRENIWNTNTNGNDPTKGTNTLSSGAGAISNNKEGSSASSFGSSPLPSVRNNQPLSSPSIASSPSVHYRSDEESGPTDDSNTNPILHGNGTGVSTVPSLITINNSSSSPSPLSTPSSSGVRLQRMEYGIDIGSPHVKIIETPSSSLSLSGIDTTTLSDYNELINNLHINNSYNNNATTNSLVIDNVTNNDTNDNNNNVYLDSLITTTSSSSLLLNPKQSKKGNQVITKRSTQSTKRDENDIGTGNGSNDSINEDTLSSPNHGSNSTNNSGMGTGSEHNSSGISLLSNSSTKRD